MWWECSECGGHVERVRAPAVCRECGTADSLRAVWLQAGLEQARGARAS